MTQDQVDVIGWMDLTKFGVLSQKDVNKIGAWCERILAKNPTGSLSISLSLIGCSHGGGVGVMVSPLDVNTFCLTSFF